MSVITLEGIVEQGQIRLPANIHLPEKTKVYVIVPGVKSESVGRILVLVSRTPIKLQISGWK